MEGYRRRSGRELQMTAAENMKCLWPVLVVLVHDTIKSPRFAECRMARPNVV